MTKLAVIIPTYNRKQYLRTLLIQIYRQIPGNFEIVAVVVVVDGSTDGTADMLQNEFPRVEIVYGDGSFWYTKCINKGFEEAIKYKPHYILTMNDDTEISDNYLNLLLSAASENKHAIIGSLSLSYETPHKVFFSGVKTKATILKGATHYIREFDLLNDNLELSGVYPSLELPARGMLIPKKILNDLKKFDEKLPQYGSDKDFCCRAKLKGYDVLVCWDAIVYSHLQMTGLGASFVAENLLDFIKGLFYKYSRSYLLKDWIILCRYYKFPFLLLLKNIMAKFKNHFFGKKIYKR